MVNMLLVNKIISFIPSKTLKDAIKKTNHEFSVNDLIGIIIEYAPTRNEMIETLIEFKKNIQDNDVIKTINKYLKNETKKYDLLTKHEEHYIYEVSMYPGELGSSFLVYDFESCFDLIKEYLKCNKNYKKHIFCNAIQIRKRKIGANRTKLELKTHTDDVCFAEIDTNLNIKRIYSNSYITDYKVIKFPEIFKEGDLIYIDKKNCPSLELEQYFYNNRYDDKGRLYGITSGNNVDDLFDCSFVFLDTDDVKEKTISINSKGYCSYWYNHTHIDWGIIEKANLNEINSEVKEDYEYAYQKLVELGCLKNRRSNNE